LPHFNKLLTKSKYFFQKNSKIYKNADNHPKNSDLKTGKMYDTGFLGQKSSDEPPIENPQKKPGLQSANPAEKFKNIRSWISNSANTPA
jgi:hypothetical protein